MTIPRKTPPRLLHANPFMRIMQVDADFGTFDKSYFIVEFGPRAGVIALRENHVLLARQYRNLPDRPCWEIPGGKVEAGERAEDAARRECLEETGVHCRSLEPLLVYYPGLDNVENRTSLFVCTDPVVERGFQPDHREVTALSWVPVETAVAMIFRQEIMDAMSIAGILGYCQGPGFQGGKAPETDKPDGGET